MSVWQITVFDSTKPPSSPGKWVTRVLLFVNGPVRRDIWEMAYCGGPVSCLRPTFNVWYRTIMRSTFIHPDNLPHCWCLGDRKVLQEAPTLVPDRLRVLLVEAESKLTELKSINLGHKRTLNVAESILWTKLCGVQFTAEVAATVSLEEVTKGLSGPAAVPRTPPLSAMVIARQTPLRTT